MAVMTIRIGTSGWSYDHWDGVLYPHGTPPRARLEHYVREFDTVELNASFYRWPRDATFAGWRRRLPDGFAMSVKAPRGLTHAKRLLEPEVWAGRIARRWHELGPTARASCSSSCGPTTSATTRASTGSSARCPTGCASRSSCATRRGCDDAVFAILERHRAAYVVMSGANLPCVLRATAPFVYVRLHGPDHEHLYGGSYSDDDLRWWADRIREWAADGRDVLAYFNNDGGGNAVRNARTLRALLA